MARISGNADIVSFIMHNAARFPLLTSDREIELSRQVQAMVKVLELTESQRPEDWPSIVNRGKRAKDLMIQSNLRLVVNVAQRYRNRGLPFEDLIQEGTIGLSRGVELFDPERGYKASTYLYAWIKQSITLAIGNASRMIRLPIYMKDRIHKLQSLTREMMQATGKRPSAETLREAMELDEKQWKYTLGALRDAISYDVLVSTKDSETSLVELLPSELETPQDRLEALCERERLASILNGIDRREAHVLELRYGIDRGEGRSLAEVGKVMGLSRERVRQIENKAMRSAQKVAQEFQWSA
ncbi:RNA polymerase sigma factor RpoD/SigA [Altericista sp. CCNU0014]|uniref:sigma-70 family RNA polymerase sigma factor n=1 Tax=Altericista sp. CCNU0014 TaxID=3082949 RepID=UPI00384D8E78